MISEQETRNCYDKCKSLLREIREHAHIRGANTTARTLALSVSGVTGQLLAYGTVLGMTPEQIEHDLMHAPKALEMQ